MNQAKEPTEGGSSSPTTGTQSKTTGRSSVQTRKSAVGQNHPVGLPFQEGPILAFDVAGQRYGLPVENVVQIIEIVNINHLPAAPSFIAGVIDYRGQVIPVVDMRRRLGHPAPCYTLHTPIVVSQLDGHMVALIVDGVSDVVNLRAEQVELLAQVVGEKLRPQTGYVAGIARLEHGLLLLLDPAAVFSVEEAKALTTAMPRRRRQRKKG